MGRPVGKRVVDQNPRKGKADKDTDAPEDFSPYGLCLADVDKTMKGGRLQELSHRTHQVHNKSLHIDLTLLFKQTPFVVGTS